MLAAPHPAPASFRRRFFLDIHIRKPAVGKRLTLQNQPGVQVLTAEDAHGQQTPVIVTVHTEPIYWTASNVFPQGLGDLLPAPPSGAIGQTNLITLRCVYPAQPNPFLPHLERSAVDHANAASERFPPGEFWHQQQERNKPGHGYRVTTFPHERYHPLSGTGLLWREGRMELEPLK